MLFRSVSGSVFCGQSFVWKYFYQWKRLWTGVICIFGVDAYNTGLYVTPVQEVSRKEQYLQEIEDTALWYRQISLSTEDRLVVMSTCTENITNGRHILIGKLSKQTYKDTYKKTLKRNSQIDRIDWGIFWKTSMKRLGVLILLLFSILLLMAVERSGKRKKTKNNSRKLEN